MEIELYFSEMLKKLKAISHYEVSEIADQEARYRAEAGSEKNEQIVRCINEGMAQAERRCIRYLKERYDKYSDNTLKVPDSVVFDFAMSERRAIGKAEPLASCLQDLIVHYALSMFYSSVSQGDLSNKHSLLAIEAGNVLTDLLYTKQPPRV